MILAIDIGNTNVKLGVFSEDGKLLDSTRLSSSTHKTSDEYFLAIRDSFASRGIDLGAIDGVIISSVNPNLNYTFEHLISFYFKVKPMIVGSGIKTGLNIRYDNPKEVGAERIVNSVAGYSTYGGPCVVVDCGTATTFTVLDESGALVASAITAGVELSLEALRTQTAQLPTVALTRGAKYDVMARNTADAMRIGAVLGAAAMVDGLVERYAACLGSTPQVWLTGDCAPLIAPHLSIDWDRTDDLIFEGLRLVWSRNRG